MRRIVLDPPRMALEEIGFSRARAAVGRGVGARTLDRRAPLAASAVASERRRPLFHPRRGWFRRLERALAQFLAGKVYPGIPGISRPYATQLRRDLTLSEAEIVLPGLGPVFDGTRVLLITDVHAGPFLSPPALERAFDRLLGTQPDLVLLGGDLVTSHVHDLARFRDAFRLLRAPLGTWAVLGNHEHYTRDLPGVEAEMAAAGIRLLRDAWTPIEVDGERFALAGVDDSLLGRPDLERALEGAPRPVVLLSHNPDLLFEAARCGVSLMLSGHTHAGQIRVPGLPVLVRQSRYRLDEGRYRAGATELVVSRGLGAVGLPWRHACPPEAVLLRLRAAVMAVSG